MLFWGMEEKRKRRGEEREEGLGESHIMSTAAAEVAVS